MFQYFLGIPRYCPKTVAYNVSVGVHSYLAHFVGHTTRPLLVGECNSAFNTQSVIFSVVVAFEILFSSTRIQLLTVSRNISTLSLGTHGALCTVRKRGA